MKLGRSLSLVRAIACVALVTMPGCSREPTTPEAKRQRGDEVVRKMSDRLSGAATFTVQAVDTRERTRGGQKVTLHTTRQVTVRRPDRIAMQVTGDAEIKGWYDGQKLTFVSDAQKVWARVDGGATIDDTLDRLAERLAMPMPIADFLYSSPFDALIGSASTGGYVGRETVGGVACSHLTYDHPGASWDLWVAEDGEPLPKRFRVTDKTVAPARTFDVTFDKWVLGTPVADTAFTPVVPAGYERIPLVVQAEEAPAAAASQPAPPTP